MKYYYLAEFLQTAFRFIDGTDPVLGETKSMADGISMRFQPWVKVDYAYDQSEGSN